LLAQQAAGGGKPVHQIGGAGECLIKSLLKSHKHHCFLTRQGIR